MRGVVTKTQGLICEAMKDLLREGEYDDITVQNIVDRAKVSRSSFYNHFEKKEDVIYLIIDKLVDKIAAREEFSDLDRMGEAEITQIRTKVIDFSRDHAEDIKLLFKAGFGADYSKMVRTRLFEVRNLFAYEFEDELGNKTVLSEGILYDLKTWADVNDTVSALELYYEKYSDMSSEEYYRMIQKANKMSVTGKLYRKLK